MSGLAGQLDTALWCVCVNSLLARIWQGWLTKQLWSVGCRAALAIFTGVTGSPMRWWHPDLPCWRAFAIHLKAAGADVLSCSVHLSLFPIKSSEGQAHRVVEVFLAVGWRILVYLVSEWES